MCGICNSSDGHKRALEGKLEEEEEGVRRIKLRRQGNQPRERWKAIVKAFVLYLRRYK